MMHQPMGSNNILGNFQRFMQNPAGFLQIPQGMAKDPQAMIQHLMDTGRINQQQYMQAKRMADQMRDNPMFRQMFNR